MRDIINVTDSLFAAAEFLLSAADHLPHELQHHLLELHSLEMRVERLIDRLIGDQSDLMLFDADEYLRSQ